MTISCNLKSITGADPAQRLDGKATEISSICLNFFLVCLFFKDTIESVYKPSWQSTMETVAGDLADQTTAALVTETV